MEVWQFIVSIIVAVVFSDVAAVITTLIYQASKAKKARLTSLRSLMNEVGRIEKVARGNSQLRPQETAQPVTRVPVAAFEAAFVAGDPGLYVREKLLQAVTDYLAHADSVNSLVEIYTASISGIGTSGTSYSSYFIGKIVEESQQLLEVLERLKPLLDAEIGRSRA